MGRLRSATVGILIVGILIGVVAALMAGASSGLALPGTISSGDTAFVLISSALVLIMTPAVGLFYGGMVRSKNISTMINQSIIILAVVSIQWVLFGYSLAFGNDVGGVIGGLNFALLNGVGYAPNPAYAATIPQLVYMIFQAMFAIVTPALIIGAFAERVKLSALVIFTLVWATLVYDPTAHWIWGTGGWANQLGILDFAGGTVVHASAGFSALAAVIVIGRRRGVRPGESTPASNIPLVLLGAALLWFGWFGFNSGSALSAGPLAASAFVATNTAAAAGGLTWLVLSWAEKGKPSSMAAATGAICGLAAVTPASGFVGPISAMAIGVLAGLATYLALYWLNNRTKIDDTLGVWPAHGIGGFVGVILTGFFAEAVINPAGNNGLLFGNPGQVGIQVSVDLIVVLYSFLVTLAIVYAIDRFIGFRVTEVEEAEGLDLAESGEVGHVD
ncbi:MAG TPA: ammonium transporter [Methanomassiliicoccales archaeon]|nr:ammonium transporter [Methanomassiliicoccales archaeon]